MPTPNIRQKSYAFALEVVHAAKALQARKEFVLSDQFLRAGTGIGANIEEANAAQTKREFVAKMSIASKEARETHYWIGLLRDSGYLAQGPSADLSEKCLALVRMLTAIVKTSQTTSKH